MTKTGLSTRVPEYWWWRLSLCVLFVLVVRGVSAAERSRPNVVFILLDNVGQEWFGCYGSEENCTPHIDQLARSGVRVENCYASPVCGPSRTMLLTGRYPHTTGFRLHHDAALYSGGGLDPARDIIFPRLFRDAGYVTGITGKWQINNLYDEPGILGQHGFQEHLVWPGSIDRGKVPAAEMERFHDIVRRESYDEAVAFNRHIESRYWDPVFLRNGRREVLTGKFGPDESQAFAIDFLRRHRDRPFLLYVPMVLTHGQSFTQNVVTTPRNRNPDRPHRDMFADMLRYADQLIGELVAELDRLNLRDDTLVFVASDNGTERNLTARRGGRLTQGDLYALTEAGGNVALLANCPTRILGGRVMPLADFTDLYPTLCELAGVPISDRYPLDGVSFAPYLLDAAAMPPRSWILNEYHETRVVRDRRYKLYSDGRFFDAERDAQELTDLSASADTTVVAARQRLEAVLASIPPDTPPPFVLRSLSAFKIRSEKREHSQSPPPCSAADDRDASFTNSIGMKLVRIPAGEFFMGSADSDPGARDDEKPRHRVRITKPFYLGAYEVTQSEFETVMGNNPSSFTRAGLLKKAPEDLECARLPVDNVTWYAAIEFCRHLSIRPEEKEAGRVYRLPTEAEWEYACRAGTATPFSFGDSLSSTQANFHGSFPFGNGSIGPFLNRTATVGSYAPNAFGLYDMHGNLHEWCLDRFDRDYYRKSPVDDPRGPDQGTSRVIRGGDWYSDARDCRSAFRYADIPDGRFYALGMRVVCELVSEGARLDPIIASAGTGETPPGSPAAPVKLAGTPRPNAGEEWPRWRGPRGDGTWGGPKLPATWPVGGLPYVWRQPIGGGYGGIAVSGGRVCVMDRQRQPEDLERVLCFDAVSGELLWSHSWPVDYSGVSYDNGPRSTPTMFQGRVYVLGAVGHLFCFDAASGSVLWSKNLVREYAARVPAWGLSASPVIFESLLIVHAGAEPGGCYLAFDLRTGEERWRSVSDRAGYATPILIKHDGKPQLAAWTPSNVRGLDPATGEILWSVPFEVNYGTSIADPIFHEGLVLVSSYYEGSQAIRVSRGEPVIAWHDQRNLRGLMSQPLYRNGFAYLIDKRHGLTCFEWATGRKVWDDDNRLTPKGRNPQATLVWLGDEDRAIALNSDGELILARLNPTGYIEESRTKILGGTWAHPAYSGNCVYARSDSEIVCVLLPQGH